MNSKHLTLLTLLFCCLSACAEDLNQDLDVIDEEAEFAELEALSQETPEGDTSFVVDGKADGLDSMIHECTTATVRPGGTRWAYRTTQFAVGLRSVRVYVDATKPNGSSQTYGPLVLNLQPGETHLWKDAAGKITMRLVNKRDRKPSIRIYHNAFSTLVSEENGFCRSTPIQPQAQSNRHDFYYGGRDIIEGRWRFTTYGNTAYNADSPYGFTYNFSRESDPSKKGGGRVATYRLCETVFTHTYRTDPSEHAVRLASESNQRIISRLGLFIDLLDIINQGVEYYRCSRRGDLMIPVWRLAQHYMWNQGRRGGVFPNRPRVSQDFLNQCGTGTDTLYVETKDNANRYTTHVFCMQIHGTTMYAKSFNMSSRSISQWATFVQDTQ